MVFIAPRSQSVSTVFYLLSVFLALVALPFSMGALMAYHPFGAWGHEQVEHPLRHLHPMAMALIVFMGLGFAFWVQEVARKLEKPVSSSAKIRAWAWGFVWMFAWCLAARFGMVEKHFPSPNIQLLLLIVSGCWMPILVIYVWAIYFQDVRKTRFPSTQSQALQ